MARIISFVTGLILYFSTAVLTQLAPIQSDIIQKLNSGPITQNDISIIGNEKDNATGIFYSYVGRSLYCTVNSSLVAPGYVWTRLNDGQRYVGQNVTLNTAGQNLRYSCQATITDGGSNYTANRTISLNVFPYKGPISENDISITGQETNATGTFYSYVGRSLYCTVNSSLAAHSYVWTRLYNGQRYMYVGQFVTLSATGPNLLYSCQATVTEGGSNYTAIRTISIYVLPNQGLETMEANVTSGSTSSVRPTTTTTARTNYSAIQQSGSEFKFAILVLLLLHLADS